MQSSSYRRTTMLALLRQRPSARGSAGDGAAARRGPPTPLRRGPRMRPPPLLDEGKTLFEQARFSLAVAKLQEAIGVLEDEPDAARRRGALTDAFLHLGLAFIGLNEREAARDAFKNVLRLDPDFHPDPEILAPKVIELFEQARLGLPVSPAATGGADATAASGSARAAVRTPGRLRFGFGIFAMRARYAERTQFARAPEPGLRRAARRGWRDRAARRGVGVCSRTSRTAETVSKSRSRTWMARRARTNRRASSPPSC